jgi:hypothetical protein
MTVSRSLATALVLVVALMAVVSLSLLPSATKTLRAPTPGPTQATPPWPTSAFCGDPLQHRIDTSSAGGILNLTGCSYATGATVSRSLTIVGGTIAPPRGTPGLVVTASDVTVDGLQVTGPKVMEYDAREVGIRVEGTVATPISGLVIRNCQLGDLGYGGMYVQHVVDFVLEANRIHDAVYAGIMVVSGRDGRISGNSIQRIGPPAASTTDATGSNAYGIALTRGDGSLAADPRSTDIVVSDNTVEDVPTWHAFDTHGGQRITWTGNVARGSRSGIFITGSESPDGTLRSLDVDVEGNTLYAPSSADHYAITSVYSTGGQVRDNTIVGWPAGHGLLTTSDGDPLATAVDLTISGNVAR